MDADLEDMGESYLKHWPEPVRTWRVRPADSTAMVAFKPSLPPAQEDLRPTIAVIPLDCSTGLDEHQVIGELIADGVIAQLSRSRQMRVISRLSTTAFRGRGAQLSDIQAHLGSGYVLSGSYSVLGDRVVVMDGGNILTDGDPRTVFAQAERVIAAAMASERAAMRRDMDLLR